MSHPLARPSSALRPPSSGFTPYTGDGTTASVAQWAKTIPVKETVIHEGQTVEVYNLRQRIVILSPSYGFQVTEFYLSAYVACLKVTALYRMPDGSIARLPIIADRVNVPNDSHIDRTRNTITNIWHDQDFFDLAWSWDVDIPLLPEFLWLAFQHLTSGRQFVCGHYAMKDIIPTFVANIAHPDAKPTLVLDLVKDQVTTPDENLHVLMDGGTGAMGLHRSVITRLRQHPEVLPYICAPNSPFPGRVHWAYFSSGPYGDGVELAGLTPEDRTAIHEAKGPGAITRIQQWLSEDWKLCRIWQELGGKVYGDRRIKLQHFGGLLYPPTVESLTLATQAMIRGNHPAVQADKLRAALEAYRLPEDGGQKTEDGLELKKAA